MVVVSAARRLGGGRAWPRRGLPLEKPGDMTLFCRCFLLLMSPLTSSRTILRVGHLVLVLLLAFLPLLPPVLRGHGLDAHFWVTNLAVVAAAVVVYYLNLLLAVPRLLFRGRWALYLLLLLALTAGLYVLSFAVAAPPTRPAGAPPARQNDRHLGGGPRSGDFHDREAIVVLSAALVLGAGTMRAISRRSQQETERRRQAETEKLEVELAYLRAQLNPHVFFNTLNSIYVLTDLNLAQAKQALIRLSRLMRYLLYQTQEASVPLSQEITFLEDYVALMKLRLTPNMVVDFDYPEEVGHQLLAPMLLQPFIENAFKYGLSTTQPATISIRLTQSLESQTLTLEVRNRVFAVPQTGFDAGSGIGLVNTRRRLELLYPNRHTLATTERTETEEFVIHLTLHLT